MKPAILWIMSLAVSLATGSVAYAQPFAKVTLLPDAIAVTANEPVDTITIRVAGENFDFKQQTAVTDIVVPLITMELHVDGNYHYEVTGVKFTGETYPVSGDGRTPGSVGKKSVVNTVSGEFKVSNQTIQTPSYQ